MTFQVPTSQSTPSITLSASSAPTEISQSLPVGTVLAVQVAYDPSLGSDGIIVNGRFVPATLPTGTFPGQQINVQVLKNTDAIVLKILSDTSLDLNAILNGLPDSLKEDLNALLTPKNLQALKLTSIPFQQDLPNAITPPPSELTANDKAIASLLKLITSPTTTITEEVTSNPDKLLNSLLTLSQKSISGSVDQAKEAIDEMASNYLPPNKAELLRNLTEILKALGSTYEAAPPQPTEEGGNFDKTLRDIISNSIFKSYKIELSPEALNNIQAKELTIKRDVLFAHLFGLIDKGTKSNSEHANRLESELQEQLVSLRREIKATLISGANEQKIKQTLAKALKTLSEKFEIPSSNINPQTIAQSLALLRTFDNLSSAKDVLDKLNPMMQAMGEPAFILFPSIAQGLMTRWGMTIEQKVEQDESGKKRPNSKLFERIRLNLPLTGLGTVEVDLAYRDKELYLNLTVEEDSAREAIDSRAHLLEAAFRSLGYTEVGFNIAAGCPKDITPGWVKELAKEMDVVA